MKIVIAGDSFTYGQGCKDRISFYKISTRQWIENFTWDQPPSEYSWPSLLQKHYPEHEIINLAKPGVDNTYICKSILDHIDTADIVFFASTAMGRMQVASLDGIHTQPLIFAAYNHCLYTTNSETEYRQAIDLFVKRLYIDNYFAIVLVSTIWCIYGHCLKKNIPFIWSENKPKLKDIFYGKKELESLINSIDQLSNCEIPSLNNYSYDFRIVKSIMHHQDGHANENGHEYYFNNEILPVFSKFIGR